MVLAFVGLGMIGLGLWFFRPGSAPAGLPGGSHLAEIRSADVLALAAKKPVTIVNLWASWCEPCKAEFPGLLKLREKYAEKGLQILFISVDSKSERPAAEEFLKGLKVDFPTYVSADSAEQLGAQLDPHWEGAVPSSFLFNSAGKLVDSWQGETSQEQFEAKIKPLLGPL